MIRLDEQVAIVTGGGRGLGLAYALLLAERGARFVLHDIGADREGLSSDPGVATAAVMAIEGAGGTAIASAVGLDARGLSRAGRGGHVALRPSRHPGPQRGLGRLPAGRGDHARVPEERAMDIHVQAPTWLAQSVFPIMARVGYGRIVLTTSDRAIYKQYAQRGWPPTPWARWPRSAS